MCMCVRLYLCMCVCMYVCMRVCPIRAPTVAIELIVQHIRDFLNNRTRGDTESNAVFLLDTNASAAIKGRQPAGSNSHTHHEAPLAGDHASTNCSTASAVMHTPH